MYKKIFALVIIIIAVAIIFTNREIVSTNQSGVTSTPLPNSDKKSVGEEDLISYDDFSLHVAEIKVGNVDSMKLIPNFEEELPSSEIAKNGKCKNIVNTGFYTEERTPIGLFVTDKGVLSSFQNNNTLNGVLSISEEGKPTITYGEPFSPRLAVQTGPVIVFKGEVVELNLQRDFYARRVVAANDMKNNLYFLAVYNPESSIQGPNLIDLGQLIKDYSKRNNIEIDNAINLDGGSSSTFFSDSVTLEELVPVGSVFCMI